MAAEQRTSCRLRALGDSLKVFEIASETHLSAHQQTAHIHSHKPAAAPLGYRSTYWKSTNLTLKVIKGLCPGKAWVLFNLVGI